MTLVSQIITEAYRESNNIAIGQTPTAAEETERWRYVTTTGITVADTTAVTANDLAIHIDYI